MLAEKEAYLVAGLDEFVSAEKTAEPEAPRVAQPCLFESKLIARMKAGEMSAFDELVEEYQPLVYALSFRILGDAEDARDAAQETFLKIYRHFARFRGEASLKTWICRIAINQARSSERWWRRRFRNATSSLDAPLGLAKDEDRTLADALELLKLPREVGEFEQKPVVINIGRFGPYVLHDKKFVSIPKGEDPYEISSERAIELIKAKREADENKIIKLFDVNPEIQILNGRYGAYIKAGKKNVKIPKGKEPSELTLEECVELAANAPERKGRFFRKKKE